MFSSREFIEICARNFGEGYKPFEIPVHGSGPDRSFWALQNPEPFGLRSFSLAPGGLHASPGWVGRLTRATLAGIVDRMKGAGSRKFGWKVLFEQRELSEGLEELGLEASTESTHVLHLTAGYERVFSGYSASIRNQVRKAHARGVTVRQALDEQTVRAYYAVHTELADQKGSYEHIHPLSLFVDLVHLPFCRLLVAEVEGRVVAGALFFEEKSCVVYWHGATARSASSFFPIRAVMDDGVRRACEMGAGSLNFGGSAGIESLAKFKESWGAIVESNRVFGWRNPLWESLTRVKRRFSRREAAG
ncbi:MAG: GNAT family N-acetyltransferase [Acidobacteriota bacterium]